MDSKNKTALMAALKSMHRALPILLGVLLLISLATVLVPKTFVSGLFTGSYADPVIAAIAGSILAGNPITSYVLGGELLKIGISIIAVTAFLVAWVTVGVVQLPAEIMMLGKRFAILRNGLSFIFSIIVAIVTVILLEVI